MFSVDIINMMLIITAIDDKIHLLEQQLEHGDEDDPMLPWIEEELFRYSTLASELRLAYLQEREKNPVLQDYATLIKSA
ncbi:hypothetical protein V8J88_21625 [Massilia sp. W12]|uniref:hypothetical protein n=1 Tax=Massilia sp. W12 TaxID=3126507 RepID=UPI0030CB6068